MENVLTELTWHADDQLLTRIDQLLSHARGEEVKAESDSNDEEEDEDENDGEHNYPHWTDFV